MEAPADDKLVPVHVFFKDCLLDLALIGLSDSFQDGQMIVVRLMMKYG